MWSNQDTGDKGGGYMNTTENFGGSPQAGGDDRKNRQRAQTMIPCTVAQVLSSQQVDDKFLVDNIELHQVTMVGMVRSVKESATRIEYQVDDMTGPPLDVRQFVDNDESTPDEERIAALRENMYIRVFGHVRSFQGKHSVAAFLIKPIVDMNEITTHMLEVIHTHSALTKGGVQGNAGMVMENNVNYGTSSATDSSYQGAKPDQGLTPTQSQVHTVITGCMEEQGVSLSVIFEKIRGVPQHAIREAVEFLSNEGHIYSTIDDEHFKSTESM